MLDTPNESPLSTIAQVKHLQEEIARLSAKAREEALEQAQLAIDTLNALGFPFRLVDDAKTTRKTPRKRNAVAGDCPVCSFATDPPHDARRHRTQGEDKHPFTDDELIHLGLRRVS